MSVISGQRHRSISFSESEVVEPVHPMLTPDRLLKPSDELTQRRKTAQAAQETLSQLQAQQRGWFAATACFGFAAIAIPAAGIGVAQAGNEQVGNYLVVGGLFGSALLAGSCYLKATGYNQPIQQARADLRRAERAVLESEKEEMGRYGQVIALIANCTADNLRETLAKINQMGLKMQMTPQVLHKIKKVVVLQHLAKVREKLAEKREEDAPLASEIVVMQKQIRSLQQQLDGLAASRQGLADEVREMEESLRDSERAIANNWNLNLTTDSSRLIALDRALDEMDRVLFDGDDAGSFAIPSSALSNVRLSTVEMGRLETVREDDDKKFEVSDSKSSASKEPSFSDLPDPSSLPPPPPVPGSKGKEEKKE